MVVKSTVDDDNTVTRRKLPQRNSALGRQYIHRYSALSRATPSRASGYYIAANDYPYLYMYMPLALA